MNKKIERFLELSFKFSLNKDQMFPEYTINKDQMLPEYALPSNIAYYAYGTFTGRLLAEQHEGRCSVKTISEKIMEEARNKAELAEEFEEYIKLQKELQDYYQALNKLNN